MGDQDIKEILDRLARIETKLEDDRPRLYNLERQVGRQNFVASMLGALAAGAVLMIKYIAGRP